MKVVRLVRGCAVSLACLGLLIPQGALGAGPVRCAEKPETADSMVDSQTRVLDVALLDGGELRGQVMDREGSPAIQTEVSVSRQGQVVKTTRTDAEGKFRVTGLRGGVYVIATADASGVYRLWASNTAPPVAQPDVLIVAGGDAVRGQSGFRNGVMQFLSNPWVIAAIVATAIAVPLALDKDDGS